MGRLWKSTRQLASALNLLVIFVTWENEFKNFCVATSCSPLNGSHALRLWDLALNIKVSPITSKLFKDSEVIKSDSIEYSCDTIVTLLFIYINLSFPRNCFIYLCFTLLKWCILFQCAFPCQWFSSCCFLFFIDICPSEEEVNNMIETSLCSDVKASCAIVALLILDALLLESVQNVGVSIICCIVEAVVTLSVLAINFRSWCTQH